jgi:hypothetical protein
MRRWEIRSVVLMPQLKKRCRGYPEYRVDGAGFHLRCLRLGLCEANTVLLARWTDRIRE